ncbi:hypothetical protein SAMN04487950_0866 [Halogranum rubrum]|uniref:Uncharacterized protein n=1 Tax=Halogranum rubrum TaxID=553466 RepID=A0A1I4C082_9EURY|nr:hypothetical protein [Halogranum rubrum]SFK74163.1 hypothetical protein SAMN04487950_0866 [Halogranum rubrum]
MPSTQSNRSHPRVRRELLFYAGSVVLIGVVTPIVTAWDVLLSVEGALFGALGSLFGVVGMWSDGLTRVRGRSTPSRAQFVAIFVASLLGQALFALVPTPTIAGIFGFLGAMATIRVGQVVTGQYP